MSAFALIALYGCSDGEGMADYDLKCERQFGGKAGDSGGAHAMRRREIAIADCKARLRGYKDDVDRYRRERSR
jgi:hypothetical protein